MSLTREYPILSRSAPAGRRQITAPGELVIRREHRADELILWLSGELDSVTSSLLELELAAVGRPPRLVVDLTGLEFVDAHGLHALAHAHYRARENGDRLWIERTHAGIGRHRV